ncbi:MAG: ABC transporter ATP-binding protein [Candidatus Limnocylindrales bacterium]
MSDARDVAVRLDHISKSFDDVVALDDVNIELESGTMLALLGPSGCGKTTALRLISGFERPDAGTVEVNGRRVASPSSMVPPERRRVGLVFQDLALFPHLSVRANVAYGIRRDPDHHVRTDELLELVGLAGDGGRMPHELSGGMQQRVALARALAPRPDVLLLDEPFSSLDQAMRTQLRAEVREILREARQSAIFVTHDQGEALTVADRVAVMTRGRVLQVAPPELIYAEPATPYVATFVGVANLVPGELARGRADTRFGPVPLVGSASRTIEGHGLVLLRPEHFAIHEAPDGPADGAGWEVIARRFSGSEILLEVRATDGQRLWVEAGSRVRHLGIGDRVAVSLREIETVAFGRRTPDTSASAARSAQSPARPEASRATR